MRGSDADIPLLKTLPQQIQHLDIGGQVDFFVNIALSWMTTAYCRGDVSLPGTLGLGLENCHEPWEDEDSIRMPLEIAGLMCLRAAPWAIRL